MFGENNGSYSAFIVWCYNQLCYFTQKSTPVIFGSKSLATVTDCVTAVCKECDSLQAIGIDLTFPLLNLYNPHLCQVRFVVGVANGLDCMYVHCGCTYSVEPLAGIIIGCQKPWYISHVLSVIQLPQPGLLSFWIFCSAVVFHMSWLQDVYTCNYMYASLVPRLHVEWTFFPAHA